MFIHYRTLGLIFKKEDRGEFDQLLSVFSKDFGKIEILGKGIKKISSKLRAGMEIFYLSKIEFIQGKRYKTLTDALKIEKFENLRKDLKRLAVAYKISEDLDNFIRGEEPDEKIWQLIIEVFEKLNNLSFVINYLSLLYYYFFWNLISILGYKPELYNCAVCQKNLSTYFAKKYGLDRAQMILCSGLLPEKIYFSQKEGGIICQNCSKKFKTLIEIKPETVKMLRKILEKDWKILSKLKIEENYLKPLGEISQNYSLFISEKEHDNMKKNSQRGFSSFPPSL